jgi:hypothetical protein
MDESVARELIAATRQLADALEASLGAGEVGSRPMVDADRASKTPFSFDPERDSIPFEPKVVGTRREQDLCCLIMFGRVYAINVRLGRGATLTELREIAGAAGYRDARAWAGWGKYATERDADGQLWVTEVGHAEWIPKMAERLNFVLPDDIAAWAPPA